MKRRVLLVTMLVGLMGLAVPLTPMAADPPITIEQVRNTILECGLKGARETYEFDHDAGNSRVENIALNNHNEVITFDLVRNDRRTTSHSMYRQGTRWEGDLTFGALCMRPLDRTAAVN